MTVLIVEDEGRVRHLLRPLLSEQGLDVVGAASLDDAIDLLSRETFEVILVDVPLADRSFADDTGFASIAQVRSAGSHGHVIVVSSSSSEGDLVRALEAGADDYVVKPFLVGELLARILAVHRRHDQEVGGHLAVGRVAIDLQARLVTLDDEPLELTVMEFDLLAFLASHPRSAFTRDQLLKEVWHSTSAWQVPATVTEHIRRLRTKIERPDEPRLVQTVRGVGYRLDLPPAVPSAVVAPASPSTVGAPAPSMVLVPGGLSGSVVHHDGRIVVADAVAASLLGYGDEQDLVGRRVLDLVAPASMEAATQRLATSYSGTPQRSQVIDLHVGQAVTSFEVSSSPVDWHGRPAVRAVFIDALDPSLRLRALATGVLTELADAVIITDLHLHIRSWNTAAERMYGWTSREAIGRHVLDLLPWFESGDELKATWEKFQTDGRWMGEGEQVTRDGSVIRVLGSTTLVRDEAGEPIGVVSVNRPAPGAVLLDRGTNRTHDDERVRAALDRHEFVVHYQPIVRLADRRIRGFEALARWNHPTRGMLDAADFIFSVERSDLILELGMLVLDTACHQAAEWRRAGADVEMAVNLAARQLADPDLVERISEVLAASGLAAEGLWLEVTETSLVEEVETAGDVLRKLVALGVRVAIDDFGTGWASLAYLRNFPVQLLKIDKSFVGGIGRDPTDTAIARSILSLASELDLAVVAEGIETAGQEDGLRRLGCSLGQGYLYGHPTAAADAPIEQVGRVDLPRPAPSLGRTATPPVLAPRAPARERRHTPNLASAGVDAGAGVEDREDVPGLIRQLLSDRRTLDHVIATPWAGVVAMVDLDGLQDVIDRDGRAVSDEIVTALAAALVDETRPCDTMCRLGDDGFALVMVDLDVRDAAEVLDEVRRVWRTRAPRPVTFSVGIAEVTDRGASAALLAAERALVRAKALGRDRTEIATENEDGGLPEQRP